MTSRTGRTAAPIERLAEVLRVEEGQPRSRSTTAREEPRRTGRSAKLLSSSHA